MKSGAARAQVLVARVAQALAGRQLALSDAARAARVAVAVAAGLWNVGLQSAAPYCSAA